jgi:hypothetical protein
MHLQYKILVPTLHFYWHRSKQTYVEKKKPSVSFKYNGPAIM